MNKEVIDSFYLPNISLKPTYDTLYIYAKRVIIKDTELGMEIDLKERVNQLNKIVIDGITFVKENKDEKEN